MVQHNCFSDRDYSFRLGYILVYGLFNVVMQAVTTSGTFHPQAHSLFCCPRRSFGGGAGHSVGLQCQGHSLPHPPPGSWLPDQLGNRLRWAEPSTRLLRTSLLSDFPLSFLVSHFVSEIPVQPVLWVCAGKMSLLSCTFNCLIRSDTAAQFPPRFVCVCTRSCHRGGEKALGLAGPQPASLSVCIREQGRCCQLRQRESQGVESARMNAVRGYRDVLTWCGFKGFVESKSDKAKSTAVYLVIMTYN